MEDRTSAADPPRPRRPAAGDWGVRGFRRPGPERTIRGLRRGDGDGGRTMTTARRLVIGLLSLAALLSGQLRTMDAIAPPGADAASRLRFEVTVARRLVSGPPDG